MTSERVEPPAPWFSYEGFALMGAGAGDNSATNPSEAATAALLATTYISHRYSPRTRILVNLCVLFKVLTYFQPFFSLLDFWTAASEQFAPTPTYQLMRQIAHIYVGARTNFLAKLGPTEYRANSPGHLPELAGLSALLVELVDKWAPTYQAGNYFALRQEAYEHPSANSNTQLFKAKLLWPDELRRFRQELFRLLPQLPAFKRKRQILSSSPMPSPSRQHGAHRKRVREQEKSGGLIEDMGYLEISDSEGETEVTSPCEQIQSRRGRLASADTSALVVPPETLTRPTRIVETAGVDHASTGVAHVHGSMSSSRLATGVGGRGIINSSSETGSVPRSISSGPEADQNQWEDSTVMDIDDDLAAALTVATPTSTAPNSSVIPKRTVAALTATTKQHAFSGKSMAATTMTAVSGSNQNALNGTPQGRIPSCPQSGHEVLDDPFTNNKDTEMSPGLSIFALPIRGSPKKPLFPHIGNTASTGVRIAKRNDVSGPSSPRQINKRASADLQSQDVEMQEHPNYTSDAEDWTQMSGRKLCGTASLSAMIREWLEKRESGPVLPQF